MADSEKLHPREFYLTELNYHRNRIASIFAWASGLLFTSLGGNALVSKLLENHPTASDASPQPEKFRDPILVIPVIIITIFAMLWMYHHAAAAHANRLLLRRADGVSTEPSSGETEGSRESAPDRTILLRLRGVTAATDTTADTAFSHIGSAVLTLLGVGVAVGVLIVFSP